MSEEQFRNEIWRHAIAILKAIALYWFGKRINIGGDAPS
jgi:hypothetical protein